jgi:hypothetical protein
LKVNLKNFTNLFQKGTRRVLLRIHQNNIIMWFNEQGEEDTKKYFNRT